MRLLALEEEEEKEKEERRCLPKFVLKCDLLKSDHSLIYVSESESEMVQQMQMFKRSRKRSFLTGLIFLKTIMNYLLCIIIYIS